jgi:glycosyltransferase involved in cell wall biosynthesis
VNASVSNRWLKVTQAAGDLLRLVTRGRSGALLPVVGASTYSQRSVHAAPAGDARYSPPLMTPRVLLVVNATVATRPPAGPRKDYAVLRQVLDATVLDLSAVENSRPGRILRRLVGASVAQAWLAFRQRKQYDAIVTDGEQAGIPLALLLKLARSRVKLVTIGHRITAAKKRPFFRWLRVQSHINRIVLHSQRQYELAIDELSIPGERLALVPYQVDPDFWRPRPGREERLICSVGLEFRDYPTLISAVEGLNASVVIAAGSQWSKRRNTAGEGLLPPNVHVNRFDYFALRDLYERSAVVVVPLSDTDFQAGVTTILEAMAMGKPVIVTHSWGQTDVIEDRRAVTRGPNPRSRSASFLRSFAQRSGIDLAPTGFYVPPQDPHALRRAITYLLEHPEQREMLGANGRRTVQQLTTVDQFAQRIRAVLNDAVGQPAPQRPIKASASSAAS